MSKIGMLLQLYDSSLKALGAKPADEDLEAWVLGIHDAMTGRSRAFHQLDHVFEVSAGLGPIETLAAIYHDCVYYQVDMRIAPVLFEKIRDAIDIRDNKVLVANPITEPVAVMVLRVFAFQPGMELAYQSGLNEFLSALIAARDLRTVLPMEQLAVIAGCIEATIPFRDVDAEGFGYPERLAQRLAGLTPDAEEAVRCAVRVSNSDVANFASEDPSRFLDNTWLLLPETNPDLHTVGVYSIGKLRTALQRMESFLARLKPNLIFHTYTSEPEPKIHAERLRRAGSNLAIAVKYLRAKILPLAIIESIAELTGGIKNSPFAAYLCSAFGEEGIATHVARARNMFAGTLSRTEFLQGFPAGLIEQILKAIPEFAVTRKKKCEELAESLIPASAASPATQSSI